MIKKIFQPISNHQITLRERLLRLMTVISLVAAVIFVIVSLVIGGNGYSIAVISAFTLLLLGISLVSIHTGHIAIGVNLISFLMVFIMIPAIFVTSGGMYGGAPFWILFCMVFVSLNLLGKNRVAYLIAGMLITIICYVVGYVRPDLLMQRTLNAAYVDSLTSLILVGTMIVSMLIFQNRIYLSETKVAEKQRQEIEELNKSQNRFFSSMSHEIRTPINTIIGLNEMILREDISDEVAKDARTIQGAGKMLLALINDILDMSKIQSGKMDIVPITYETGELLSDVVSMVWGRAMDKGLAFHVDVDKTLPKQLHGDEVRIKQILINILNNAVKYTKEGSITLSVQFERKENYRALVTFSVTDTGIGIKKENIPYLFDAFKRVDQEKNSKIEGTGLGLSIVKQLVDLMEGEISVNSIYTKGSTFTVSLMQEIASDATVGELNLGSASENRVRDKYVPSFTAPMANVLVVDDNKSNLLVAQKLLRDTQVSIDTAMSGREALNMTLNRQYHAILMDHLMPEMDGIECLHAIRNQTGGLNISTPVIILTANAGSENQALYRREGFDGYLLKPVSGVSLEAEILRILPADIVNRTKRTEDPGTESESLFRDFTRKFPVLITTDSVCDLPASYAKEEHLAIIPYRVYTENGLFLDGEEIETDGILYHLVDKNRGARSLAPSPSDYEQFFASQLTKAQHIIHISMAKNVSDGYKNALDAAKSFDNVSVVDSGHVSSGVGLAVIRALEMAKDERAVPEILNTLEDLQDDIRTSFILGTTEYLTEAGRLSSRVDTISRLFLLRPVISLKNSTLRTAGIRFGTQTRCWKKYIASQLRNPARIDRTYLFITYAGLSQDDLDMIKRQVLDHVYFQNVILQKASAPITVNCGPGSFGIIYKRKPIEKNDDYYEEKNDWIF